uniref:ORF3 n=1 Tax=Nitrosopumilaceae spindle-shaped virus TaxID=3065433 RepID=A0AAT9J9V2_9VIRU
MFGLNDAQEVYIGIVVGLGVLYFYWTVRNIKRKKKAKTNHWKEKKLAKRQKDKV